MKYVWLTWIFACYPLGSAEIDYSVIVGMPKASVACRYDVEDNNCAVKIRTSVLDEDLRYFRHKQKRRELK